MKKLIVILTLCMFTSLTVATPIAAADATNCQKNTKIITSNNVGDIKQFLNTNELASKFAGTKCNNLQALLNTSAGKLCTSNNCKNAACTDNCTSESKCSNTCIDNTCTKSNNNAAINNNTQVKNVKNVKPSITKVNKKNKTKKAKKSKTTKKVTNAKKTNTGTTSTKPSSNTTTTTSTKPSTGTTTTNSTKPTTTTTNSTKPASTTTTTSSYKEFQIRVVQLVNKERAAAGLSALTEKAELDKVATLKSEDMAKLGYFDHTSPTYGTPFQMLKQFGINYSAAGENIAYGQSSPEEVMKGWMNSPGHRANILNSNYTQIGVGIAKKPNGQLVWTQTFLRP